MELIVITPDQLKQIIKDCLREMNLLNEKHKPEPIKYLYGIKELATFLGCSIPTAHKIKMSGKIRCKQIGRKLIFSTTEILEDIALKNKFQGNKRS